MDIAKIGFAADTSDLDKAVQKLNAIRPAAAGAAAATNKITVAAEGAAASAAQAAYAVAKAEASRAAAINKQTQASKTATQAEKDAARAARDNAAAIALVAKAERDRVNAINAAARATRKNEAATESYTNALRQEAAAAQAAQSTPAASGKPGMPMPANDQMPNRFNTANIAAQFQDIGVTAAMGMNPLLIAMQQGTQLSAILNTMERPLQGIAIAFRSILNPVSLLSIGFVALIAAGLQFVDWISVAQSALNGLADILEATAPYAAGLSLALALIYAPTIIAGIGTVIAWIYNLGRAAMVTSSQMVIAWAAANPYTAFAVGFALLAALIVAFRDDVKNVLGFDLVEAAKTAINKIIGFFVGGFQVILEGWRNIGREMRGEARIELGNIFEEALNKDYVGSAVNGIKTAASAAADKLRAAAAGLAASEGKKAGKGAKTEGEKFDDIVKGAERSIESLKAEQAALGLTEAAAARLKHETELLNQAQQKGITLTPQQRAQLGELAQTMADLEENIRKTKEVMDFTKDAARGFFSDIRSGLQEGKGLWESFGNAVTNVLNKIIDKLGDLLINDFFDMLNQSGPSSGSGFASMASSVASFLGFADGGAFSGGVQKFAKGGDFTNSVVSRPTLFSFAKGTSMGQMGEAGPEAIMPLHRGSDGSLGVRVDGMGGGSNVYVTVNNNASNAGAKVNQQQTPNGVEIEVMIDEIVANKLGDNSSMTTRAINARSNRRMIGRG